MLDIIVHDTKLSLIAHNTFCRKLFFAQYGSLVQYDNFNLLLLLRCLMFVHQSYFVGP